MLFYLSNCQLNPQTGFVASVVLLITFGFVTRLDRSAAATQQQTVDAQTVEAQVEEVQQELTTRQQQEESTDEVERPGEQPRELTLQNDEAEGRIVVNIGEDCFTVFDHRSFDKPILYPVFGPGQVPMTRNFPMAVIPGEENDHPHHKSMWTGHEINHVDFWTEKNGKVVLQSIEEIDNEKKLFRASSNWINKENDSVVLTDKSTYQFGFDQQTRWIDVTQTFIASHGDVTFHDTKEGMFAIRVHPRLRIKPAPEHGLTEVTGQIVNSNGLRDNDVWGQQATWIDYSGKVEESDFGISIFDHPTNLRHPTTWHARGYGLFAANPFGLHHFQGAEPGTGEYTIAEGEELTLRYRAIFHSGDHEVSEIARRYNEWAQSPDPGQDDGGTSDRRSSENEIRK